MWYITPVLRRCAVVVVLAGVAVSFGLPLLRAAWADVAGPRAVRLVATNGKRVSGQWQAWANASLVPTVAGQVTLKVTGCPGLPKAAGCVYTRSPRVVYVRRDVRHPRAVLLHELGHVYDLTVMSNRDRGEFRRIMRRPHAQWWRGNIPLAEWFAEAYSWCARYARIASVDDYAIYSYDPSPAQHRSTCALIRRAARDRTPPAPPPTPPIVTEDPAPPAAPPVAPTRRARRPGTGSRAGAERARDHEADPDADPAGDRLPHRPDPDADRVADADPDTHANADSHADTDSPAAADADANSVTHTHAGAHPDGDADRDPRAGTDRGTHRRADAAPRTLALSAVASWAPWTGRCSGGPRCCRR